MTQPQPQKPRTLKTTKQINLNSSASIKNNGAYNSDVVFSFKNIISNRDEIDYIDVSLDNAQFPVSFYNINSNNNNILKISVNGGPTQTITITPGNYNSTSLQSELLTQFTNEGINITMSFSTITGKYIFAIDAGYFTFHYSGSTCFKILGFTLDEDHTSVAQALTSLFAINLLGPLKLSIYSQAFHIDNISSLGNNNNCLLEIPISAPNFGLIQYNNNSNIHNISQQKILNNIDITIKDDTNQLVNFNNQNWSITILLKIYYLK